MRKFFSMLAVAGLVGATWVPEAIACGGSGGAGCAMSGGGGYAHAGGRAVAYGKANGRAPMLAQAPAPATTIAAVKKPAASPTAQTVADKVRATAKAPAGSPLYTCPMHPQVQSTKPADCPICGMKLKTKASKPDATKRAPATSDEHTGMNMENMSKTTDMGHDRMGDMNAMQMCPGCTMNMQKMSNMSGKQAPAASQKASGGTTRMAAMRCGC